MNTHTHTLHLDLSIINIILYFWLPVSLSTLSHTHIIIFVEPFERKLQIPSFPPKYFSISLLRIRILCIQSQYNY